MARQSRFVVILCAMIVCVIVDAARGGSVNPPVGPIAPTDRVTLSQTLTPPPYVIASPGSYVLTSDLTAAGGGFVLLITANGVTLDLNGFTIDGAGLTNAGIEITGKDVRVHNGRIVGCVTHGIICVAGSDIVVEDIRIHNCDYGILIPSTSRIARCELEFCASGGIIGGALMNVDSVRLSSCGTVPGTSALQVANQSTVRDCEIAGCSIGVNALADVVVERCLVQATDSAFIGMSGVEFRSCTARVPSGTGFRLFDSRAIECRAMGCGVGIDAVNDSVVDGCAVIDAANDGIRVGDRCTITRNTVSRSGFAFPGAGGVRITGTRSRVSGNHAADNAAFNFFCGGLTTAAYGNSAAGLGVSNYVIGGSDVAPVTTAAASTNANDNISN